MGKTVFLKVKKKKKIAYLASVLCFFVSGTVSGSIKSDLDGFWLIFFSLCHRLKSETTKHKKKKSVEFLPRLSEILTCTLTRFTLEEIVPDS